MRPPESGPKIGHTQNVQKTNNWSLTGAVDHNGSCSDNVTIEVVQYLASLRATQTAVSQYNLICNAGSIAAIEKVWPDRKPIFR